MVGCLGARDGVQTFGALIGGGGGVLVWGFVLFWGGGGVVLCL